METALIIQRLAKMGGRGAAQLDFMIAQGIDLFDSFLPGCKNGVDGAVPAVSIDDRPL